MEFKEDLCDKCGVCFVKCPEVRMDDGAAKAAIAQMIEGNGGSEMGEILSRCSSCFSCNTYCPTDANPYYLVLERWNDLYKARGAPPIYKFVCPNQKENMWNTLNPLSSSEEKKDFRSWDQNVKSPGENPLILGNYAHLFPHIADSPVFSDFTIFDPIGHWECGAYINQAGYTDEVEKIACMVKEYFDPLKDKEIYILTDAVLFLLTEFIPKRFGIEYTPKFRSFTYKLLEMLKSGELPIKEKVNLRFSIHDSCYAKAVGRPLFDAAREILSETGAEVVELPHIRNDSYCCGFGRGAADISKAKIPFEIMKGAMRKLKEAEAVGADGIVTYCTGCMYLLWSARELMGSKIAVYHIVEPVTMAMGAYKYHDLKRQRRRAWDIISLITYTYTKSLFQKRFKLGDVSDNRYSPDKAGSYPVLKFIRAIFSIPPVRWVYALGFRGLTRVL